LSALGKHWSDYMAALVSVPVCMCVLSMTS
jgi:hypothetical protein